MAFSVARRRHADGGRHRPGWWHCSWTGRTGRVPAR